MHADNGLVSENFIFDFIKGKGNKVSYGVFSRNLIICNANLSHDNVAIGLSLGGGSANIEHRNEAKYEQSGGVIHNNIIMNCSSDVGLYPLPFKMQVSEWLSNFNSRRCDVIMVIPL